MMYGICALCIREGLDAYKHSGLQLPLITTCLDCGMAFAAWFSALVYQNESPCLPFQTTNTLNRPVDIGREYHKLVTLYEGTHLDCVGGKTLILICRRLV
jgi:hypothetical protein